jgi:hypothetical protein
MANPGSGTAAPGNDSTIAIKVSFELNTPDGKRRVQFGLEKDFIGGDIIWRINFQLWERTDTTKAYTDPIVSLDVQVNPQLNARAEAATKGLTPSQTAHATGPAADAAKAAKAGELPVEVAQEPCGSKLIRNATGTHLWSAPLCFLAAVSLCGQTSPNQQVIAAEGCGQGINFESEHYSIGTATVRDPFDFLYWVRSKASATETQIGTMLNGKPFTYELAIHDAIGLIEGQRFLPDNATGFRATVILAAATNCRQNPNTLDLKYQVYSTMPAKILSGTPESQAQAKQAPQDTAGLTQGGSAVHFTPAGGYNGADRWFGGGSLAVTRRIAGFPLFNSLEAEGRGSSTMREASLALAGSAEPSGSIEHLDWRLNYFESDNPANSADLRRAQLSAQFSAATRPLAGGNVTFRFGSGLEGGNLHGTFAAGQLPADTVPGAGYGALKLYAGVASRLTHNVFSATYGLELGSIGPGGTHRLAQTYRRRGG